MDKTKRALRFDKSLSKNSLENLRAVLKEARQLFKNAAPIPGISKTYHSGKNYIDMQPYVGRPNVLFHFSELPKLGINPRSGFSTPLGIYGYPLIDHTWDQLKSNSLPFGSDRLYIHVFQISPAPLYLNEVGEDDVQRYLQMAKVLFPDLIEKGSTGLYGADSESKGEEEFVRTYMYHTSPGKKFWKMTEGLAINFGGNKTLTWSRILRAFGLSGVVDLGQDIIYSGEPYQGLALTGPNAVHLDTFYNPHNMKYREYVAEKWRAKPGASKEQRQKHIERVTKYIQYAPKEAIRNIIMGGSPEDVDTIVRLLPDSKEFRYVAYNSNIWTSTLINILDKTKEEAVLSAILRIINDNTSTFGLSEDDIAQYKDLAAKFIEGGFASQLVNTYPFDVRTLARTIVKNDQLKYLTEEIIESVSDLSVLETIADYLEDASLIPNLLKKDQSGRVLKKILSNNKLEIEEDTLKEIAQEYAGDRDNLYHILRYSKKINDPEWVRFVLRLMEEESEAENLKSFTGTMPSVSTYAQKIISSATNPTVIEDTLSSYYNIENARMAIENHDVDPNLVLEIVKEEPQLMGNALLYNTPDIAHLLLPKALDKPNLIINYADRFIFNEIPEENLNLILDKLPSYNPTLMIQIIARLLITLSEMKNPIYWRKILQALEASSLEEASLNSLKNLEYRIESYDKAMPKHLYEKILETIRKFKDDEDTSKRASYFRRTLKR